MAEEKRNSVFNAYRPGAEEEGRIGEVYTAYDFMWENVMDKNYPEFNDRTLKQFIDDSQKRANGYMPSRDMQGKLSWQANVFTGTTRNKVRAYASSMAKEPPQIRISAWNEKNERSLERAEISSKLVRHSYMNDNPALGIFWDGWDGCIDGTVIKYDGYLLVKDKVEVVTKFDPTTGKVETETVDEVIEDKHIEIKIPVVNFLIRDPFEPDVQKQPEIIWAQYLELEDFLYEYGKYPNSKQVKTKLNLKERGDEATTFFGRKLTDRLEENKIEVLHYYRKRGTDGKSHYRIIANGVEVFDGPLLWGRKRKIYPFAKSGFEPFSNRSFFWLNSLPNILMPHQDVENSLVNSMLDKTTRSLTTPMLVSMDNKSMLDLEDSYITNDTNIYVNNIDGIRPMPVQEITQGELTMLKDVSSRLSLASLDSLQEGFSKSGATAREIVISNEKSAEIKGIFYLLLTDLWLQKTKLRLQAVLTHYGRVGKRYSLETDLSSGAKGRMEIRVAKPTEIEGLNKTIGFRQNGVPFNSLDVFEEEQKLKGDPMEVLVIPPTYLDEWEYDIEVIPESTYQQSKSLEMALQTEKIDTIAKLFPEIFMQNKAKFFERTLRVFGDDPRQYDIPEPAAAPMGAPEAPGGPQNAPGLGEMMAQLKAPAQSLGALTGAQ